MKEGDIVIVDEGHPNGGYEAEIVWSTGMFSKIRYEGHEWELMTDRLKLKENV